MKDKSKSGLGEFWDNWIEEAEQEKKSIQELIEKRKREAKGNYEDSGESKTL